MARRPVRIPALDRAVSGDGRRQWWAVLVLATAACSGGDAVGSVLSTSWLTSTTTSSVLGSAEDDQFSAASDALHDACGDAGSRVTLIGTDLRAPYLGNLVREFAASAGVTVHPVAAGLEPSAQRLMLRAAAGGAPTAWSAIDTPELAEVDAASAAALAADGALVDGGLAAGIGDDVPAGLVGDGAQWVAPWVGVVAFVVVDDATGSGSTPIAAGYPASFAALADDRRLTVALPGDPRVDPASFAAVMGASLASGGSADDLLPGVDYFARLRRRGRLVTESPDVYLEVGSSAVARRDMLEAGGVHATIVYPTDGVVAVPTVYTSLRGGARPACADEWIRFVLSDRASPHLAAAGLVPARWAAPGALRRHAVRALECPVEVVHLAHPAQHLAEALLTVLLDQMLDRTLA
ncbi:MAG: ABC transporter substrate-binding protein, partial [Ilumatobacteraceae bacterium]